MPEMRFKIRWPDGTDESCYSPSLVMREHLTPGASYALEDFRSRARTALEIASERVRARYGHACSLALGQLARIEGRCEEFRSRADALVDVVSFEN